MPFTSSIIPNDKVLVTNLDVETYKIIIIASYIRSIRAEVTIAPINFRVKLATFRDFSNFVEIVSYYIPKTYQFVILAFRSTPD
ncbi:MAG: hypothetical protein AMJ79_01250 [Phycisphaerae bacterium SM23_30]|nr:MAG: hypothetical protein AMJ79_01250 [Phycisphaerae bacterium SM23_30]